MFSNAGLGRRDRRGLIGGTKRAFMSNEEKTKDLFFLFSSCQQQAIQ